MSDRSRPEGLCYLVCHWNSSSNTGKGLLVSVPLKYAQLQSKLSLRWVLLDPFPSFCYFRRTELSRADTRQTGKWFEEPSRYLKFPSRVTWRTELYQPQPRWFVFDEFEIPSTYLASLSARITITLVSIGTSESTNIIASAVDGPRTALLSCDAGCTLTGELQHPTRCADSSATHDASVRSVMCPGELAYVQATTNDVIFLYDSFILQTLNWTVFWNIKYQKAVYRID